MNDWLLNTWNNGGSEGEQASIIMRLLDAAEELICDWVDNPAVDDDVQVCGISQGHLRKINRALEELRNEQLS